MRKNTLVNVGWEKLKWILFGAIFIIFLLFNFDNGTFSEFILFAIIHTLITSGIVILIYKSIKSIKERKRKQFIKLVLLIIFSLFLIFFVYDNWPHLCTMAIIPPHFRTNIFTNDCDFGGGGPNGCFHDPWYYKNGCDISNNEKLNIFRKEYCENYCKTSDQEDYKDIFICDEINC